MSFQEEQLSPDLLALIPRAALEGATIVGAHSEAPPAQIVAAINAFVAAPPKKSMFKRVDNWNERAMPLGALWGSQLVRRFTWQWTMVEEDGEKAIGVFDARRSQGVYPFDYVFGCLEAGEYPTIELMWNLMEAGQIPTFEDRTYTNVMDGVRHVVPPV